jgi:flagellar motility protein MotE (MotC chaperone)
MRAMQKIIELEEMQINGTIKIIEKLRSDLATRLAEQRSALESAKTEVEKNITGTPELMTVSEVQRVRLDRQIEQFEELQRVLVRV